MSVALADPQATQRAINEFQSKIVERLKSDIASMLPDEVLNGLVSRAIEEMFFKSNRVNRGNAYHDDWVEVPSVFVRTANEAAQPMIEKCVAEHVEKNQERIEAAINGFLDDNKLMLMLAKAMSDKLSTVVDDWMHGNGLD